MIEAAEGYEGKSTDGVQAILALQTGLRGDMADADAWEALGCAYQSLGRLSAAVKASPCTITRGMRVLIVLKSD